MDKNLQETRIVIQVVEEGILANISKFWSMRGRGQWSFQVAWFNLWSLMDIRHLVLVM